MHKKWIAFALALLLCLALFAAPACAEDDGPVLSKPPKISALLICKEGGSTWVQVSVKIATATRNQMRLLASFGMGDYYSGLDMLLTVDGGTQQKLTLSPTAEGDRWSGPWRSGSLSGLRENSWLQAQIRYTGKDENGATVYSDWSEVFAINEDSEETPVEEPFEFNAHDWAKPELTEADGAGLIPADLRSADLKAPITRAEFAAVSVKVYEALSGLKADPAAVNPFTDTADLEVLKALNVGVTNGVSDTEFAPSSLLNREQAATMLSRVYKKVAFVGWTLTTDGDYADAFRALFTMPEPFADDADISSWARDSVYFMAANDVLNGVGNNCFAPKLLTSGEETLNHATREQAILIAVRLVKNLGG